MKIIRLSQTTDREAWLEERRSKIMGTKFDKIAPLQRKKDGTTTPVGFWDLLAEFISVAPDSSKKSMERGHDVERNAILGALELLGIDVDTVDLDPGMWIADDNPNVGSSPDAAELGDRPTFAIEAKCFDSGKHLRTIIYDAVCKRIDDREFMASLPPVLIEVLPDIPSVYNPLNSVPKDNRSQVVQYFVTNEDQEIVHVALHDDRMALPKYENYVITVTRKDVEGDIAIQKDIEERQLDKIKQLLKALEKGLF